MSRVGMKKPEQCRAGHTMSTENIYWDSKHGVAYAVCRTCRAARTRKRYRETSLTKAERDELNKRPVIQNYNIKKITNCPKCDGILKWEQDSRLDDRVACVYCGWRPTAYLGEKKE